MSKKKKNIKPQTYIVDALEFGATRALDKLFDFYVTAAPHVVDVVEIVHKNIHLSPPNVGRIKKCTNTIRDINQYRKNIIIETNNKTSLGILQHSLTNTYNVFPGMLLKTNKKCMLYELKTNEQKLVYIDKNSVIMFLGADTDEKFSFISIKLLVDNKILHMIKSSNVCIDEYIVMFQTNFSSIGI